MLNNIELNMPDVYGYGQIFAFSALDGVTSFKNDFVGTLTEKPIGIRFELKKPVTLFFDTEIQKSNIITSDIIDIDTTSGNITIVYKDCGTVIGTSSIIPKLITKYSVKAYQDGAVCGGMFRKVALVYVKTREDYKFALSYAKDVNTARNMALSALECDIQEIKSNRLAFYRKHSSQIKHYQKLYLKCLSVLKGNIYSPEGKISCRFTTPDRVPHKNMWLWDSVFHAFAIKDFCPETAKQAIDAVLCCQRKDGFIPHMMTPYLSSKITQPPVLALGVWEVYQKTLDKAYIKTIALKLSNYLLWDIKNRDSDNNGLPEWKTERNKNCRCGECGMDNSPRFDNPHSMDAIDFSCFLANDCLYLSLIYTEIEDAKNALVWRKKYDDLSQKIRTLLWDEEDGIFYDRFRTGEFNKVATSASFLPLMSGIATIEQAERLVKHLQDNKKFFSPMPVPSLSMDHNKFCSDMWRGSVWLNYNYMIILGLRKYGYNALAEDIAQKSLNAVKKWYDTSGAIYEFYDAFNEKRPDMLIRKGVAQQNPDWRFHMHAICDYGWSAAFTSLLINDSINCQQEWKNRNLQNEKQ